MLILKIILGVLMIVGASTLLATPLLTGTVICYILSALMLVYGIFAIVGYIEAKNAEKVAKRNGLPHFKTGIGSLIFGIASIVVSVLARSSVIGETLFVCIIASVYGLWIVLNGVCYIVGGVGLKKLALPGWIALIAVGVLMIATGIFCAVNAFASLTAMGTFYGISMMISGFGLIFSAANE